MKKIIPLIIILTLAGCSSNHEFKKTCKLKNETKEIIENETKEITFNNKDEITSVIITKSYKPVGNNIETLTNIKESSKEYNNVLIKKEGINIAIIEDSKEAYEIKYYLDVKKMKEKDLKIFELQKNSIKFFNKMRQNNIKCA